MSVTETIEFSTGDAKKADNPVKPLEPSSEDSESDSESSKKYRKLVAIYKEILADSKSEVRMIWSKLLKDSADAADMATIVGLNAQLALVKEKLMAYEKLKGTKSR